MNLSCNNNYSFLLNNQNIESKRLLSRQTYDTITNLPCDDISEDCVEVCDPLDPEDEVPPLHNDKTQLNGQWDKHLEDIFERTFWWSNQDETNIISDQEYFNNLGL